MKVLELTGGLVPGEINIGGIRVKVESGNQTQSGGSSASIGELPAVLGKSSEVSTDGAITDVVPADYGNTSNDNSTTNDAVKTKIYIAQYPADRKGVDANGVPLYRNGLKFKAYNYTERTSEALVGIRRQEQRTDWDSSGAGAAGSTTDKTVILNLINSAVQAVENKGGKTTVSNNLIKNKVADITMPMSKTNADIISHKFNDVGESLITKGGGTATGILSNIASTNLFSSLDSMTKGIMADKGEQIYTAGRSMYAGPDNRTKTFTWDLIPRTQADLIQIIRIYQTFAYLSYGVTGNSKFAKDLKNTIDEWYKKTIIDKVTPGGTEVDKNSTIMSHVTEFLSNVIVVSNPTVWMVEPVGGETQFTGMKDPFGPAQIQSIRFDKSPDGQFNGLHSDPNLPASFQLEVVMREISVLNRYTLYDGEL